MTESTKHTVEKIPELYVEQLVLGELDDAAKNALRERLNEEGAQDRISELQKSNQEILSEYAPAQLAASIRLRYEKSQEARRRHRLMVWLPVSAAVGAAAVLMFTVVPFGSDVNHSVPSKIAPNDDLGVWDRPGDVRIKGDALLTVKKKTVDGQQQLSSGDVVSDGDEVQLTFKAGHARSVVVVSVDGRGAITLHYPQSESSPTDVKPMSTHVLPFGYQLDDAPEFERFFMVWSETENPVSVDEVQTAVEAMKNAKSDVPQFRSPLKFKDITLKK
ncbi:MAG: hypothetical protein JXR76_02100 [Deltaproteobacteria bacterium]|nr:hypothetical protein [Deltaproteobacteria bacterium]